MEDGEVTDSDSDDDFEVAIDPDCQCEPCRWNYQKSLEYDAAA